MFYQIVINFAILCIFAADFAMDCGYLTTERYKKLTGECSFIGSMLGKMINNPDPFIIQKVK
jgi:hypothetical protein